MTKLKLGPLADDRPVKLTVELPASIHRDLAAYAAALAFGGVDEGAPGPRPADSTTFYGAYVRDATGNKIAIFTRP